MRTEAIHEQVETLRVAISAGLRYVPCVLLALLLGVLNPALCVLHCYLMHGPQAAQNASLTHAHHGDSHGNAHERGACAAAGLPQTPNHMPQAAYELMPVALALAALVLAAVARAPRAPWRPRVAQPLQPLTPPPKALAFS